MGPFCWQLQGKLKPKTRPTFRSDYHSSQLFPLEAQIHCLIWKSILFVTWKPYPGKMALQESFFLKCPGSQPPPLYPSTFCLPPPRHSRGWQLLPHILIFLPICGTGLGVPAGQSPPLLQLQLLSLAVVDMEKLLSGCLRRAFSWVAH